MYFSWTQSSPRHSLVQTPQPMHPSDKLTLQPVWKENPGREDMMNGEKKIWELTSLLHSNGNMAYDAPQLPVSYQSLRAQVRLKKKETFNVVPTNHVIIMTTVGETRRKEKKSSPKIYYEILDFAPPPLLPFYRLFGNEKLFSCCQRSSQFCCGKAASHACFQLDPVPVCHAWLMWPFCAARIRIHGLY